MSEFLGVTWDGGGNVPPMLAVAAALRDRGHVVRVLGHPVQRAAVEAADLPFRDLRHSRAQAPDARSVGLRQAVAAIRLFADRGPGRDLREVIAERRPDLVLVDCLMPAAVRAALRAGLPTAVLGHTFDAYLRAWAVGSMGRAAALRGMSPTRLWDAADLVLLTTDADLDPTPVARANGVYTGPVLPAPARPATPAEPTVLVSLSTVFHPGMPELLQRLLDALAGAPYRVLVTTGPMIDPVELRAGANTELARYLPHADLMPAVSALVGHGGHATTMAALAHDLPVLVLPLSRFLDHRMIGEAVAGAGAGRVLAADASAAEIRTAVQDLFDEPVRRAAAEVGARIRAADGAARAADVLERLLGVRPGAAARKAGVQQAGVQEAGLPEPGGPEGGLPEPDGSARCPS